MEIALFPIKFIQNHLINFSVDKQWTREEGESKLQQVMKHINEQRGQITLTLTELSRCLNINNSIVGLKFKLICQVVSI